MSVWSGIWLCFAVAPTSSNSLVFCPHCWLWASLSTLQRAHLVAFSAVTQHYYNGALFVRW